MFVYTHHHAHTHARIQAFTHRHTHNHTAPPCFFDAQRVCAGYRNVFFTDTKGSGIMTRAFKGYEEFKGDIDGIRKGVLVSMKTGDAVTEKRPHLLAPAHAHAHTQTDTHAHRHLDAVFSGQAASARCSVHQSRR